MIHFLGGGRCPAALPDLRRMQGAAAWRWRAAKGPQGPSRRPAMSHPLHAAAVAAEEGKEEVKRSVFSTVGRMASMTSRAVSALSSRHSNGAWQEWWVWESPRRLRTSTHAERGSD